MVALSPSSPAWQVSPSRSEAALKAAVAIQPTVIYFEVADDFYYYSGGLYQAAASACTNAINHAMVSLDGLNSNEIAWLMGQELWNSFDFKTWPGGANLHFITTTTATTRMNTQ